LDLTGRRRPRTRSGVAGIVAAVLLFAMLFSAGTGYFLFVNNMNTFYVKNLSDRSSAMQAQLSENLQVATAAGSGSNHLTLTVTNNGPVDSNITALYVTDPSNALHTYGIGFSSNTTPALAIGVGQGGSATIDTGIVIQTGVYKLKVVTQRGDTFSATYPTTAVSLASQALASGAIGDLYLQFHSLTWYKVVTCNITQQCLQSQGGGFSVPAASSVLPIAFSIQVTNLNSRQQNITFDQYTLMTELVPPTPGTGGGTARSYAWYIVSNSTNVLSPFSTFTLFYSKSVTLIFASSSAGTLTPYAPAITSGTITYGFIVSHGCQGIRQVNCQPSTVNYGQVAPYVSTLYY
jgi:archaellum component FlaF (FlaF/FlaG flagellin family)